MKALFLMGRVEDIGPSVSLLWLAVATCCKSVPTLLPPEWFGHRPDDARHLGHTELSQPHTRSSRITGAMGPSIPSSVLTHIAGGS